MSDTAREIQVLVNVAKLDAALNELRVELSRLPETIDKANAALGNLEANEQAAQSKLDEFAKERREIEQGIQDNAEKVTKYKNQLMEVKTNKEYQAMLSEIEHLDKDTDAKEERLLILMDEVEQEEEQHKTFKEKSGGEKAELSKLKAAAEARVKEIEGEVEKLEGQKPAVLNDLPVQLRKRYDRILGKFNDFAVTHVLDDVCQGCFRRIPPQVAVEVRTNEKMITCEGCGRMLVHYEA